MIQRKGETMAGPARLVIHPIRDVTIVNFNESTILDTLQVDQIGQELYTLVDDRACRKIILDFEKVRMLSSSALGVLITMRKKSEAIKGTIVLCSMKPDLQKLFKITRLDKLFKHYPNEAKALESFGITSAG